MKTGVLELSMEEYRKEHGINHSTLKHIARSPSHLREYVKNPPEPTRDTIFGQLLHYAVFQTHLFEEGKSHWVKPETYRNEKAEWKKWNGNATACKNWLAAHEDLPLISTADQKAIEQVAVSVFNHPAASAALAKGKPELSLFTEDPDTGLQLKCRADWLSGNAIVDLKSCEDASPDGFARSIAKFGYDSQAAFNLDVAAFLDLGKEYFLFIAVEKEPPYAVAVYELDEESIQVGRSKYRRWLSQYLECVTTDTWPAYPTDRQVISLPAWSKKSEEIAMLEYSARPMLPAA